MRGSRELSAQQRGAQRARILGAARGVFARQGMSATMADIAAAAGISQGLAYRYFAGKEQIVSELIHQATMAAPIEELLSRPESPLDRLRWLVSSALDKESGRLEFYGLVHAALKNSGRDENTAEWGRRQRRALDTVIRQLLIEGQRVGQILPGNPNQLARLLLASIDGLVGMALDPSYAERGPLPTPDMVLRAVQAPESSHRVAGRPLAMPPAQHRAGIDDPRSWERR